MRPRSLMILGDPEADGTVDAGDRGLVEGAEAQGVGQGGRDVGAVVALAQREDLSRVVGDEALLGRLESAQEVGRGVAELGEDGPQHVEVGRPREHRAAMRERGSLVGILRQSFMDRDGPQIEGVDVDLGLGHADREEGGRMRVGDLVAVALEGDAGLGVPPHPSPGPLLPARSRPAPEEA